MTDIEKAKAQMDYLAQAKKRFPEKYFHAWKDAKKHYERLAGKKPSRK